MEFNEGIDELKVVFEKEDTLDQRKLALEMHALLKTLLRLTKK